MTTKKTYVGERLSEGCEVYVRDEAGRQYPLPLRLEIRNHSPTGFEWGYGGSGPAQLALAILADHFGPDLPPTDCPFCGSKMNGYRCSESECGYDGEKDDKWAGIQGGTVHYQDFESVIAKLPRDRFEITSDEIEAWALRKAS